MKSSHLLVLQVCSYLISESTQIQKYDTSYVTLLSFQHSSNQFNKKKNVQLN